MSYSIDDPFVLYPGDFLLYRAAFVELIVRKVLEDNGFQHKLFGSELSPGDPNGYDALPEAFSFLIDVLCYIGYQIDIPNIDEMYLQFAEGKGFSFKVALPELDGISRYRLNKNQKEWLRILSTSKFYEMPFTFAFQLNKDRNVNLLMTVHEDVFYAWPGIADFVYNFCEFRKKIIGGASST